MVLRQFIRQPADGLSHSPFLICNIYQARQKYEIRHKVQNKLKFYFKPLSSSMITLKFSFDSSSKSDSFSRPSLTFDRNLLSKKFLGNSFSLIYTELGIGIPSLVSSR